MDPVSRPLDDLSPTETLGDPVGRFQPDQCPDLPGPRPWEPEGRKVKTFCLFLTQLVRCSLMSERFNIGLHCWSEGRKCKKGGYFLPFSDIGSQGRADVKKVLLSAQIDRSGDRVCHRVSIPTGNGYRYRPAVGIDNIKQ